MAVKKQSPYNIESINQKICKFFFDNFLNQEHEKEAYLELKKEDLEDAANNALECADQLIDLDRDEFSAQEKSALKEELKSLREHKYELEKVGLQKKEEFELSVSKTESLEQERNTLEQELENLQKRKYEVEEIVVDGGYALEQLVLSNCPIGGILVENQEGFEKFEEDYQSFKESYQNNGFNIRNLPDFSIKVTDHNGEIKEYSYKKDREVFDGKDQELDEVLSNFNEEMLSLRGKVAEKLMNFANFYAECVDMHSSLKDVSEQLNEYWLKSENQGALIENNLVENDDIEEDIVKIEIQESDSEIEKIEKCLQFEGIEFLHNYAYHFLDDDLGKSFVDNLARVQSYRKAQIIERKEEEYKNILTKELDRLKEDEQAQNEFKLENLLNEDNNENLSTCDSESAMSGEIVVEEFVA